MERKLPTLTKISKENRAKKKHHYKLSLPANERRKAIREGIFIEQKKRGYTLQQAAIAKKGRLNILRIYRRYKNPHECQKITRDMKWIDKTFLNKTGKTKNIC